MNREQAIAIIENEKECVNRANKNDYCNRDCYNCELVKTDTEILTALDMAIKALERQSENAVSRQAAIDALGEKPLAWTEGEYELGLQNQWEHDVDVIRALPPVQPKPEPECSCEQIKWERDMAIAQLNEVGYGLGEKPRTGYWIEGQTNNPNIHNILCSCCFEGFQSKGHANSQYTKEKFQYCPKCGAKMIEPQESEG